MASAQLFLTAKHFRRSVAHGATEPTCAGDYDSSTLTGLAVHARRSFGGLAI